VIAEQMTTIKPMSALAIEKVRAVQSAIMKCPPVDMPVHHTLHGGVYSRSLRIPAGVMIVGALIRVPTTLIISGRVTVWANDQTMEVDGYTVLAGSVGRKQVFVAHEDTDMTMCFATQAKTVDEAEREFTEEWELLASRSHPHLNTELITGE
jgi:hypothetical protein